MSDNLSWEELECQEDSFTTANYRSLVDALVLEIKKNEVEKEIAGLKQKYTGERNLMLAKEDALFKAQMERKVFYAKKNKQSDRYIENEKRTNWIPYATAQKQSNIDKATYQLQDKYEKILDEAEIQLEALLKSLSIIDKKEEITRLTSIYYTHFCRKEWFIPQPGRHGGMANVSLDLIDESVLPLKFSRESMENSGFLTNKGAVDVVGISESDMKILKEVSLLVHEATSDWLDAAYNETFHWHSGKPLDEYSTFFVGEEDESANTGTYFWHYGRSLEISQKPPEINEFSQHLNVQMQIQPKRFSKSSAKASSQWNILIKNTTNLLSRSRDTLNEARKMVLQMVTHPLAPSNDERNKAAATIMLWLLTWQVANLRRKSTVDDKVQLFTTMRDIHVHFQKYLDDAGKKTMKEGLNLLDGCSIRFQMTECGPFLLKDTKPQFFSHPDIPFVPDEWQKEVLNHIDKDSSCLVVAPTSAGKSFISFYTISHVLKNHLHQDQPPTKDSKKKSKQNNKLTSTLPSSKPTKGMQSKIVFVAPTLALCNQMISMINHRYKQKVKVGVFTAEFRHNVHTCEVLLCTPIIFEILLMSPSCEDWRLGLKYVILDEIHFTSIQKKRIVDPSEEVDPELVDRTMSDAYSRIFALLECPFLALSATVQAPENTRKWLQDIRNTVKLPAGMMPEVYLLPSTHATLKRWVDLQSYVFVPPSSKEAEEPINFSSPPTVGLLQHLHPISLLRIGSAKKNDATTIRLSPLEMIQLYDKMCDVLGKEKINNLNPELTKQKDLFVDRNTCTEYEKELLSTFSGLPSRLKSEVVHRFSFPFDNFPKEEGPLKYTMSHLVSHLSSNNMLPAIAFSDSTSLIERVFVETVEYLETLEAKFGVKPTVKEKRKGDAEVNEDNEEAESETNNDDNEGMTFNNRRQLTKLLQKQSLQARLDIIHSEVWPVDFKYSLRKRSDTLDTEGISFWLSRLLVGMKMKANHIFVRGLARGIAMYHAGVPKKYRDLVETLFRAGNIQLVISTQALAVGVNMPCKSVVFLTCSQYVKKVEFEQMRGRAGRRGFDTVGSTVFFHLPPKRVADLSLSPLKPLVAIPALNVDSVLRAFILRNHVTDRAAVARCVGRWLHTNPLMDITVTNPPAVFLFSVELLFRLHLINKQGRPIGVSGLVAHTFDNYPYNYAIGYLVQAGILDDIAAPFAPASKSSKQQKKEALLTLMNIFAYLAGRVPVYSPDTRVLPNLPRKVTDTLTIFNTIVSDCVEDCTAVMGSVSLPSPYVQLLPTSQINGYALDFLKYKTKETILRDNAMSDNQAYRLLTHFNGFLKKFKTAILHGVTDPLNPLAVAANTLSCKFNKYYQNIEY